jgi:transposase
MGLSIRARRWLREQQRQRLAERLEREAVAAAEAAAFHRDFLDRRRAAAHLGVSLATLRRMMTAGTSPAFVKTRGDHRQSPVLFPVAELDGWLADRRGYLATRPARMAALAAARAG